MTGVVEAIDDAIRRATGVRAAAEGDERFIDADGHALVEDETFAKPVLIPILLLVAHDAAVELIHVAKAVAAEEGGGFFAADAAGAIHEDFAFLQVGELIEVAGEVAEVLDVARDGTSEFAGVGLVAVADVDEDDVGLPLEGAFPVGGAEMVVVIRLERDAGVEGDDLGADFDDEFRKGLRVAGAELEFDAGKARIGAEGGGVAVDGGSGAGERAIDAFGGDEDPAFQPELDAELALLRRRSRVPRWGRIDKRG